MATSVTRYPLAEPLMAVPYRLTLAQYERMVEAGILGEHERAHLIDGIVVEKMTENDRHATADMLVGAELERVKPAGWHVRPGKPVRIPARESKPEPDRSVVRGNVRDYAARSPEPADIAIVVEVSDTSLAQDRAQAELYGAAGIPVYWIVNVRERQVEVHAEPGVDGYATRDVFVAGQRVPVVIEGVLAAEIAVEGMLP